MGEVREQVQEELDEILYSLGQRLDSFCEKYVKVWKEGFALQRKSVVEMDFYHFRTTAELHYTAAFEQILKWASNRGKVLMGDEFVDIQDIRERSELRPV